MIAELLRPALPIPTWVPIGVRWTPAGVGGPKDGLEPSSTPCLADGQAGGDFRPIVQKRTHRAAPVRRSAPWEIGEEAHPCP